MEPQTDLFELLRGYSALVPVKYLTFPSHLRVIDVHNFLVENILLNEHFVTYPASPGYQHSFWKWAIYHLEEGMIEVRSICGSFRS